jgi:hypothetical protein
MCTFIHRKEKDIFVPIFYFYLCVPSLFDRL